MEIIKAHVLENCKHCNEVYQNLQKEFFDILEKNYCVSDSYDCDDIEDMLGISKYPIIELIGFDHLKERFNKDKTFVYICNEYADIAKVKTYKDCVAIGVAAREDLVNQVKKLIYEK